MKEQPHSEHSVLIAKYRSLCKKYRALVDRYGADVGHERGALSLAFSAIRRSRTGMALLRSGGFLVRNIRWLALERRAGPWRCEGVLYPHLHALAIGEAGAMAHDGARVREVRFARGDDEIIEIRLEQLDRPGVPLFLAMARDVTEAVRAEREEERARSDAAERERLRAVGDLASATAHEINNVLHTMALRLASLRGQMLGGATEDGLGALSRMVDEAAARVSRLEDAAGRSAVAPALTPPPAASRAGQGRDASAGKPLHVLVVDDDPDVLEAAGLALEHLGESVELAASGAEAIARFTAGERFDLVLCDIGMPPPDGWQVARELHALAPRTPLYLVSGWSREIPPEQAQRAGVAGLLPKPLSLEALRDLLAAMPPRPRGSARPQQAPAQGTWAH